MLRKMILPIVLLSFAVPLAVVANTATPPVDQLTAAQIVEKSGGGFGDKGYQGTGLVTPKKKPEGGELTMSDKEYNSQISSLRAPVERLVAHFENWKIFHADYRRPYRTYLDAFDAARGLFFFSITWGFE